ncbi:hypothetical protein M8C13_29275 [Crossiella sp. SN42]|uniref:hypothetical protein n=1 Tax=Crossiella sp. SN42 TaxID=2944808 RepID=UPI00207C5AAC|nr:hypothetical protein [Crossiella sp. SN42]MCO1579851.1 hypothetical protein [Crossiella sp. SN42]
MNIGEPAEESCRRLVRVLPADYRAAHGEDLVVTLLDTVDERGVLPLRERLSVLALAVRLRVVTPVTGPAAAALVGMLVLVQAGMALVALLLGSVGAALFLGQLWTPPVLEGLPLSFSLGEEIAGRIASDLVFAAGWLAVLHGLLRSRRYAAPLAVALAGVPLVLQVVNNPLGLAWAGRVLLVCTLLAAVLAWRRAPLTVPGRPRRWGFAVLVATVASVAQTQFLVMLPRELWAPVIWTVAAAVVLAALVVARDRPWLLLAGSWLAAILALAHAVTDLVYTSALMPHVPATVAVAIVLAGLALLSPGGAARRVARS